MPGPQRVLLSAAGLPGPLQSHGRALQPAPARLGVCWAFPSSFLLGGPSPQAALPLANGAVVKRCFLLSFP